MERTPPDLYESRYMEGGRALARSKMRMPWWFFALLAVAVLAGPVATLATRAPLGAAIVPTLFTLAAVSLVGLLFSHLRVVATATHLHVQFGLFGPTIAYQRIRSIRALPYDWKRFGGWGIRRALDGAWCYSVPGGTGDSVEVVWEDEQGRVHNHVVSVANASEIVAVVERARAGRTGVRVAVEGSEETMDRAAQGHTEAVTKAVEKRGGSS
jgi:hypothetical protein